MLVPCDDIQSIHEYRVGPPPPLVPPYIVGVGVIQGQLAISVRVGPRARGVEQVKGLWLRSPASDLEWAFEIDGTTGIVERAPTTAASAEPVWLGRAKGGERYLYVGAMIRVLGAQ